MAGLTWFEKSDCVVPAEEALVPFSIPGVMYGESLFETMRVREGRIFRLEAHMKRLQHGLKKLGWHEVHATRIKQGIVALLRDERLNAADLRLRCTTLRLNEAGEVMCIVSAYPYKAPDKALYHLGVQGHIASTRLQPNAPWIGTKFGFRAPYIAAQDEAKRHDAWEAILLNTDGFLADGAITNIHFVQDGVVYTPDQRYGALPGTAQATVRELAEKVGIRWVSGAFRPMQLVAADEAFLTNALIGIMPLTMVDGCAVGMSQCGDITTRLMRAYNELVAQYSTPVDM